MNRPFTGYTVFDLETTGFSPRHHHRIVEIGIVRLDEELEVVERWETLINPERDLGACHIHGIEGADVEEAPKFRDVIADIWHRFEGAIPVSHNLSFDRAFLLAELEREGVQLNDFDGICTVNLARLLDVAAESRKLCDLCRYFDIELEDAHSAGADAWVCAEILRRFASQMDVCNLAIPVTCPELWARDASPLGITRQIARQRRDVAPLANLSSRVTSAHVQGFAEAKGIDEYLLALDRVLEDRTVTDDEITFLSAVAIENGLSDDQIAGVHDAYLSSLAKMALEVGIVTDAERRDLERVARLLGVDSSSMSLSRQDQGTADKVPHEDLSGKLVCFSGETSCKYDGLPLDRETEAALAEDAGLTVHPRVTKAVDILVVADPNSQSSKAKTARKYGTRIILDRAFWRKLGISVE